ncbi:MAG: iron-containing redox enzyme family protein [Mariprofundaceae bacterium]|nr:iron-containing redox enzyme family protein [Mariprofundaceae bacterium]
MLFYDCLLEQTEQERQAMLSIPFIKEGVAGNLALESYMAFLEQAYHHVKHTVPLLMACGAALPERLEWLRVALGEYIEEEMGHQAWILNDIAACGGNKERVQKGVASPATELMIAYAYDTIARVNPIGFFGMVLVLEGTSIALATHAAKNIRTSLHLPESAFSYLMSHGSLDIAHVAFYQALMNKVKRKKDKQAITHAGKMFYHLYGNIFRTLPVIASKNGN